MISLHDFVFRKSCGVIFNYLLLFFFCYPFRHLKLILNNAQNMSRRFFTLRAGFDFYAAGLPVVEVEVVARLDGGWVVLA